MVFSQEMIIFVAKNYAETTKKVMKKQKIIIERELKSNSENIIWALISTEGGLAKWVADDVTETEKQITFRWGEEWSHHEIHVANIIKKVKNDHLRLRWEDETDDDAYLEFRMEKNDLTNDYMLYVTDFALPEDLDSLRAMWDQNFEQLRQSSGL